MRISYLCQHYPKSGIRQMRSLGKNIPGVIDLCGGEPYFDTPDHIKKAAIEAITQGKTKYTAAIGNEAFLQSAANKNRQKYQKYYTTDHVCACLGGTQGVIMSLLAVIDPGDEVLLPDPGYTSYEGQVRLCGGVPVRFSLLKKDGFVPNPDVVKMYITPKTRAIILNYPHNPTGAILSKNDLLQLADMLVKHRLYIISDEVYSEFVYEGSCASPLSLSRLCDRTITVSSLSKTYAMTGWRLGYITAHPALISQISKTQEAMASCLPEFVLDAGAAALSGPQSCVAQMRKAFQKRRDLLLQGLADIRCFRPIVPAGGLCTLFDISSTGITGNQFALQLLHRAGVLTCGGEAFGSEGKNCLRISFCADEKKLIAGISKIKEFAIQFGGNHESFVYH